jgi:hypothetical protein
MRILILLAALLGLSACAPKEGIGFTCGAGATYCDEGTAT